MSVKIVKGFRAYNESVNDEDYGESFVNDSIVLVQDETDCHVHMHVGICDSNFENVVPEKLKNGNAYKFYNVSFSLEGESLVDDDEYDCDDVSGGSFNDNLFDFILHVKNIKHRLQRNGFVHDKTFYIDSNNNSLDISLSFYYNKPIANSKELYEARESINNLYQNISKFRKGSDRKFCDYGKNPIYIYPIYNPSYPSDCRYALLYGDNVDMEDVEYLYEYSKDQLKHFTILSPEAAQNDFIYKTTTLGDHIPKNLYALYVPPNGYMRYM